MAHPCSAEPNCEGCADPRDDGAGDSLVCQIPASPPVTTEKNFCLNTEKMKSPPFLAKVREGFFRLPVSSAFLGATEMV